MHNISRVSALSKTKDLRWLCMRRKANSLSAVSLDTYCMLWKWTSAQDLRTLLQDIPWHTICTCNLIPMMMRFVVIMTFWAVFILSCRALRATTWSKCSSTNREISPPSGPDKFLWDTPRALKVYCTLEHDRGPFLHVLDNVKVL